MLNCIKRLENSNKSKDFQPIICKTKAEKPTKTFIKRKKDVFVN